MKPKLKTPVLRRLHELYARMDSAYAETAGALGLSCAGCADNCCETPFSHHTYIEWLDLARAVAALPAPRQEELAVKAQEWLRIQRGSLPGVTPRVPCPLAVEKDGDLSCGLYEHRPMVCRLHGTPTYLVRPDGSRVAFPGCDRAQELARTNPEAALNRTELLTDLARLEMALAGGARGGRPRVNMSIAEIILAGPPQL